MNQQILEESFNDFYELLPDHRQNLLDLLSQFKDLFDGILGEYKCSLTIHIIVKNTAYHTTWLYAYGKRRDVAPS